MNLVWLLFDSAFDTGLGHIARLIALGQRLELEGIPFCFHGTKEPPVALVNLILQNGLNPQCECGGSPTLIIADTYNSELLHVTSKNHHVSIVQLIDEVSDFSAANALVEASPIDPSRKYGQSQPVLKFSDSPFLRDEIISAKRFANKRPSPKLKVVMILGGVDDLNYLTMLDALWKVQQLEEFEVTVFSNSDRVTEFSIQNGFTVSSELVRISQISEEYDFVISASGVTAWELSYLGIPGFVVSIAENQNFQLKYLNARRIRDGVEVGDSNLVGFILGQIRNASKTTYDTEILNGVPRVIEFLRRNNLIK